MFSVVAIFYLTTHQFFFIFNSMETLGVIPARYASTRLPAKPLLDINGKPMIQWVWESAKASSLEKVVVATDDERIYEVVKKFGQVVMTSDHSSGTDRVAEVVKKFDTEIVLDIQGDEPLLKPESIDSLIETMIQDREIKIATLISECKNREELADPNIAKVVIDRSGFALYFSRSIIPYFKKDNGVYYRHIGVYGFKRDALFEFINLPPSKLELAEELEQLRVIENGYKIKTVLTPHHTLGVDTEEHLERVRKILKQNCDSESRN